MIPKLLCRRIAESARNRPQRFLDNLVCSKRAPEKGRRDFGDFGLSFPRSSAARHRGRCSDTHNIVPAFRLDAPDQHSNIRALPAAERMQFVEGDILKIIKNRVPDRHIAAPGEHQLKHHIIRQQNMRRILAHFIAPVFVLLPRKLPERNRKLPAARGFIAFRVLPDFPRLRIDQRIHRIYDQPHHARSRAFQHFIKNSTEESQRLARTGS